MARKDISSENIDDYINFDFTGLGDDEITLTEQQSGSFPLTTISQKHGMFDIEVFYEVYLWDHWIRHHSVKKFEKAFYDSFEALKIEGLDEVKPGIFEEDEQKILLTWHLKMPVRRLHSEIKTIILKSVDIVLFETRSRLVEGKLSTGLKKYFIINGSSYTIGAALFWVALPVVCGASFLLGTIKFDAEKNSMYKQNIILEDSVNFHKKVIDYLRHNSDSALNILGHMPYDEMSLDSISHRKVQTNIENAGAALHLNK